jgi:hypothetical protein
MRVAEPLVTQLGRRIVALPSGAALDDCLGYADVLVGTAATLTTVCSLTPLLSAPHHQRQPHQGVAAPSPLYLR